MVEYHALGILLGQKPRRWFLHPLHSGLRNAGQSATTQVFVITYQHLLNLTHIHGMEVALWIALVDSVLIEESALLKL